MCVVSNIIDSGRQIWPNYPSGPAQGQWTVTDVQVGPTTEEWAEFMKLVEKARKFDELVGQPDCEDPAKTEWMEAMEKRVAELEKAAAIERSKAMHPSNWDEEEADNAYWTEFKRRMVEATEKVVNTLGTGFSSGQRS